MFHVVVVCKYVIDSHADTFSGKTNIINTFFCIISTQISVGGGEFGPCCFGLIWNWECDRNRGGSPPEKLF